MATSEAQIVNLALMRVGNRDLINSLDDPGTQAQMAMAAYETTRDSLLARVAWPFARKRMKLNLLTGVTRTGWAFAYALPLDCIQALYLWAGRVPSATSCFPREWTPGPVTPRPFVTELSDDGNSRILLTDDDAPELVYTARVAAPGLFPPLFSQALSWALACEFILVLPVKPELARVAQAQFEAALANAAIAASNESTPDPTPVSEFIAVR